MDWTLRSGQKKHSKSQPKVYMRNLKRMKRVGLITEKEAVVMKLKH